MGTPDFAAGILEAIYDSSHEIVAIVTQPDRPKGRSGAAVASPVKEFAVAHDTRLLQPLSVKARGSRNTQDHRCRYMCGRGFRTDTV